MKQFEQPEVIAVEPLLPAAAEGSERSWAWLTAMSRSLGFAAGILDACGEPRHTVGSGPAAPRLRQALSDPQSAVRAAAKGARDAPHGCAESSRPFRVLSYRLRHHGTYLGVLVLTYDGEAEATRESERALAQVGPWLAKAVEAQLARPGQIGRLAAPAPEPEPLPQFDRVSSLSRRLDEAVGYGVETELIGAFAEALFAWDGIEVIAYVEDLNGQFIPAVSTPGAPPPAAAGLEPGQAPRTPQLAELSAGVLERLGRPSSRRAFGVELTAPAGEAWALVCLEGFAPIDPERLAHYVALLRDSLARTATIAETRFTWSMIQLLLTPGAVTDAAVSGVLDEIAAALKGTSASLSVISSAGASVLSVGDARPDHQSPFTRHQTLTTTMPVGDRHSMTLSVRRPAGPVFARRDRLRLDRAAVVLAGWLPPRLPGALRPPERRAESRDFEVILERAASQALRDGLSVSVIVITLGDTVPGPDVLHRWIAEIRGQLRGADLAGMLSDREIGVLLSGTPTHEITTVSARLERCLTTERGRVPLTIGAASRDSASRSDEPMVRLARKNAVTRTGGLRELRRPR